MSDAFVPSSSSSGARWRSSPLLATAHATVLTAVAVLQPAGCPQAGKSWMDSLRFSHGIVLDGDLRFPLLTVSGSGDPIPTVAQGAFVRREGAPDGSKHPATPDVRRNRRPPRPRGSAKSLTALVLGVLCDDARVRAPPMAALREAPVQEAAERARGERARPRSALFQRRVIRPGDDGRTGATVRDRSRSCRRPPVRTRSGAGERGVGNTRATR